jgi:cation diffusion facilitator family transporter
MNSAHDSAAQIHDHTHDHALPQTPADVADQKRAMRLSFGIGVLMFFGKIFAYIITGSAAILSDAAESVVHVAAVAFAAYSLWLSFRPVDPSHQYGHDKIHFFSAGFEGGMIVLAAFYIIYVSIEKWIGGLHLENLGRGTFIVAAAAILNGGLGAYLVIAGRRHRSLILIANGRHVLTDCYTSAGVIVGLLLALWTGWLPIDPIVAIVVALNILWTGGRLIRQSIGGLMDEADPQVTAAIRELLDRRTRQLGIQYHGLRHRPAGTTLWVELHLIFNGDIPLREAHALATQLETEIQSAFPGAVEVITHLESAEDHAAIHPRNHFESFED